MRLCGGCEFFVDLPAQRGGFYNLHVGEPGVDPLFDFRCARHGEGEFGGAVGEESALLRGVPGVPAEEVIGDLLVEADDHPRLFSVDDAPGVGEMVFEVEAYGGEKIVAAFGDVADPVEGEGADLFSQVAMADEHPDAVMDNEAVGIDHPRRFFRFASCLVNDVDGAALVDAGGDGPEAFFEAAAFEGIGGFEDDNGLARVR